jgi:molybdate transport system substrate-binding protein
MKIYNCGLALAVLMGVLMSPVRGEEVLVSAAASLKDVLTELAPLCQKATGVMLTPNFAASGVLAAQIKNGAPVDIFISADDETMDGLDKAGLLQPGTRTKLLGNALVFVVPVDGTLKINGLADLTQPGIKRIGIGDPKTVPAGHYATNYLDTEKMLTILKDKLVPLDNVRTVLTAVASDNVDVGAVYRTDAIIEKKVRVAWTATDAPPINYPIAIIKNSKVTAAAAKVREFLLSDAARAVFECDGFTLPEKPAAAKPKST